MATLSKRGDGQWQSKIRKHGYPVQSKTFKTKAMAATWARNVESEMDRGVFLYARDKRDIYLTSNIFFVSTWRSLPWLSRATIL